MWKFPSVFLRLKQIHGEVLQMSVALDNLSTAVDAAIAKLAELKDEITALKEAGTQAVADEATQQVLADKLTAAVA